MTARLTVLIAFALASIALPWVSAQDIGEATPSIEIPRGPFTEDEIAEIKQVMLERINRDREAEGLPPVEHDELAADVGDIHCAVSLRNDTVGHFSLDGLSPLDRWGLAGGTDFCAENACAWEWSGAAKDWTRGELLTILYSFQDAMLAETPPNDGHRKTILNPRHTHVGIGLTLNGNEIRYTQEFVSRYVQCTALPAECTLEDKVVFGGKVVDGEKYRVDFVQVYYKEAPEPLTRAECANLHNYAFPERFVTLRPRLPEGAYYTSDKGRGEVLMNEEKTLFRFDVPWFAGSGWYGVVALLAPQDAPEGRPSDQFPATWAMVKVTRAPTP